MTDLREALQLTLGSHYTLERELGRWWLDEQERCDARDRTVQANQLRCLARPADRMTGWQAGKRGEETR